MLFLYWTIAVIFFLFFYWFAVKGCRVNWRGLFRAIVEAIIDLTCQFWIDITSFFRRKKEIEIELDDYEKKLS